MRTSGWMKKQPWFWPIKVFLKRISGKELWLKAEVHFDTVKASEWTFIDAKLGPDSIIYSLGVGDNIEFDLDLIKRFGATVYAFDPTPYATEWVATQNLPDGFVFKPWAASGEDGIIRIWESERPSRNWSGRIHIPTRLSTPSTPFPPRSGQHRSWERSPWSDEIRGPGSALPSRTQCRWTPVVPVPHR